MAPTPTLSHQPQRRPSREHERTSMVSTRASAEQPGSVDPELSKKSQKWDGMNILIDEPSTPYHGVRGDEEGAPSDSETAKARTPDVLAENCAAAEGWEPKHRVPEQESRGEDDSHLSPGELGNKATI
uniref:Uncharacterized protein n=1 Tax=Prolemur simus TaxID=1328070 RepID=A0A8C9DFB9_PROSS